MKIGNRKRFYTFIVSPSGVRICSDDDNGYRVPPKYWSSMCVERNTIAWEGLRNIFITSICWQTQEVLHYHDGFFMQRPADQLSTLTTTIWAHSCETVYRSKLTRCNIHPSFPTVRPASVRWLCKTRLHDCLLVCQGKSNNRFLYARTDGKENAEIWSLYTC